jgi:hypothetical protein
MRTLPLLTVAAVAALTGAPTGAQAPPAPPAGCEPQPSPFCADPAWPDAAAVERAPAPPLHLRAGPVDPLPAQD